MRPVCMSQAVYGEVVKQLASRGFRLGALLHFWEQLLTGEVMPAFDPSSLGCFFLIEVRAKRWSPLVFTSSGTS